MLEYENYFEKMDYSEEGVYENGFCPFTRRPCMGTDCQLGVISNDIFEGCGLDGRILG